MTQQSDGGQMEELSKWENFYAIAGSAGAVLIGLQFVILALVADLRVRATAESIRAFGTPTVLHFGVVLVVSTLMSAPWPSHLPLTIVLSLCGFTGLVYSTMVIPRARRQTVYQPDWSDWLRYAILPASIYAFLALTALLLSTIPVPALFGIAGAVLGLLLAGIHNAWDTVTYVVGAGSSSEP